MSDEITEIHYNASEGKDKDEIVNVTKALASPTRFDIIRILTDTEYDISRLAQNLDQTEANISAQVKQLEKANLVESRYEPGQHGVRKICKTSVKRIEIDIEKGTAVLYK